MDASFRVPSDSFEVSADHSEEGSDRPVVQTASGYDMASAPSSPTDRVPP